MYGDERLIDALATLPLSTHYGPWARVVALAHLQAPPPGAAPGSLPQPLWPGGAPRTGGRFTPKAGAPAVYLASEPMTALAEVEAVFEDTGETWHYLDHRPYGVFCVAGIVPGILDLTDPDVCAALATEEQELRGPWRRAQERALAGRGALPATQRLGQAAHASGRIGGLRYASAKVGGQHIPGTNLVVFADRLALGGTTGRLQVVTTGAVYEQRLP